VKDYVLTLLVAAAVTYMLTPLVRRLSGRIGAMKQPRERDVHVVPVPTLGGLAMYGGLAAGLLVSYQIPQLRSQAFPNTGIVPGLLLAGGLLVVIGFIDDRWGMGALPKAAGQVAAGGILVATGTTVSWLPLPGGNTYIPDTDQRTLLTILIVVATINAVNFIDGLDGLAAGIVGIAAVSFFIYYYSLTKVVHLSALAAPALASAILIGMCIGFLPHNFSPATIFMGDTGAMLLGLLLAYAPITGINSAPEGQLIHEINRYPVIIPLLLPAALLIVPYGDLLLAVVRRTRAGRSPFAPDRKHLHHRLLDIGHSQRASVLIMYLWAAVFSGSLVWLSVEKTVQRQGPNHHGQPIFVFVLITITALAVLLLMSMPRLRWWQRTRVVGEDAGLAAGLQSVAAVDARPQPGVAAERMLAEVSAAGLTPALGTGAESLGIQLSGGMIRPEQVPAEPVRTERLSAERPPAEVPPAEIPVAEVPLAEVPVAEVPLGESRLRRPGLTGPVRQMHEHAQQVQSLAFWRETEPQGSAADIRRSTPARSTPARSTPARPMPARPTPSAPPSALSADLPPDHGAAAPARSIIDAVPPALTGQPPPAPAGLARQPPPAPPESRWPAADSGNGDTGPLPSADEVSSDR
jgi:UDP-GlcNAc:undecaprenyl-phosphate/decaprenyl-phosphate GlcNAc-1-phosphate transferase